jgi:predicted ATPase with chaperone activity
MLSYQSTEAAFAPAIPQTYEELGIPQTIVLDLMLRRMLMDGFSNLQRLSHCLKLSLPVIDLCFRHMRQQQLVEVKGMLGNDYQFTLSQAGKQLASERFQVNQYAGPAPVSLRDYQAATQAQAARPEIDQRTLKASFSDLVVSDDLLDQLGPALISQSSIFIYGPSGNGKTSIAERMLRVYQDGVLIPYAIEVDGQIISLFDPVVHTPADIEDPEIDPRWILCRRPCIVVGGELIPSMLELRLDESSGLYAAPLQLKANNGIFIIDDFGRQLMSPRDLLNRWIVPLDRKVDYLTLRYGVKFQVPFELMVVFSTNLDPSDLADEAFLRRIHNKIYVEAVDANSFDQIFQRVMQGRRLQTDHDSSEVLRQLCLREGRTELRACYPSDIANIIMAIGKYEGQPPVITKSNLERAANLYFAKG